MRLTVNTKQQIEEKQTNGNKAAIAHAIVRNRMAEKVKQASDSMAINSSAHTAAAAAVAVAVVAAAAAAGKLCQMSQVAAGQLCQTFHATSARENLAEAIVAGYENRP